LIPPRTMSASVISRSDRQARGSPSKRRDADRRRNASSRRAQRN
jgi:hypothetical protein